MKYVVLDENDNEIQWVNDDTINELPPNARELTDDEWHDRKAAPQQTDAEILAVAKLNAEARIENSRNAAIEQPVLSEALGVAHIYSAKAESRNFLNNLITLGSGGKFTCVDADGVKSRRIHTQAQLIVVAMDFETHISAQFDHAELRLSDIAAVAELPTPTQDEFDAIVW
jgi:hypothetical protein